MTFAKCVMAPIVVAVILVMLVLYRRKTNQILLTIALATVLGGAFRLYNLVSSGQDDTQVMTTVAVIVAIMVVLWVGTWVSNRRATRKPGPKRASK